MTAKQVEYNAAHGVTGVDANGKMTGRVLCFMLSGVASAYEDVVLMWPLSSTNADTVKRGFWEVRIILAMHSNSYHIITKFYTTQVVEKVSKLGYNVCLAVADNASENRSAFLKLGGGGKEMKSFIPNPHSDPPNQPIYLLIDPVHTIKNWHVTRVISL